MQLSPYKEIISDYEVVYNLHAEADGLYLPTAFVVQRDRQGILAYIQQKAIVDTIGSFDLELDAIRKQIFELIELLQPKNLEQKFSPPRKKVKALDVLLQNEEVKPNIYKYVHRKMDEMLSLIAKHDLPISWEVERKAIVKDFLLEHGQVELKPNLAFKRNDREVLYRLKLEGEEGPWSIRQKEVIPITNHPAWLFVDYKLYKVAHINGNMVKPFRQKDIVTIPQASVITYFKRFIVKVASKLDIDAKGFDIVQYEDLEGCQIEPILDQFSDRWVLAVHMLYHNAQFSWHDKRERRTSLEFDDDDIRILHIHRNFEGEQAYITKLQGFGLKQSGISFFEVPAAQENGNQLIQWVSNNRKALEKAGFKVIGPQMEGQKIYLQKPELKLDVSQENDWFDIYGIVEIGEFKIPFKSLFKYIRDGNPMYPLPNGEYFLIPQEWMAKYQSLVNFGKIEGEALRLNKSQYTILEELEITTGEKSLETIDFEPSSKLNATLRPYQLEGAQWLVQLYHNGLGACLADDMGLGKTLQTITALLHAKENKAAKPEEEDQQEDQGQLQLFNVAADHDFLQALNALVILPASLIFNWEMEINKFAPHLTVYRHVGPKRHRDPRLLVRFDVVLTTYQTALRDVDLLEQIEFEYIVLDESQQIKNKDSKIFRAINSLNGNHKVSLSGTPIENSLSDLWSQMQFINPDLLGSFQFFKRQFITPIERRQDEAKKDRLRAMVKPYLLRRTKEEVAKDLPSLTTKVFYTEMTTEQKRLYEREKSAARNYLLDNYEADNPKFRLLVLQSLTKLRQIANHPKMVVEAYEKESGKFRDVLEHWDVIQKGGHKVLIFSSFVKYLTLFRQEFDKRETAYSWLTGQQTGIQRQKEIEKFNAQEDIRSFLISIKSGGTGLNLTAADYVFILDPWWNPSTEQQAIARAHRIGQEKSVFAVKFITKDTIEEKILKLQEKKVQLAEDIIENVRKQDFSKNDLEYLFE